MKDEALNIYVYVSVVGNILGGRLLSACFRQCGQMRVLCVYLNLMKTHSALL